MHFESYVGWRVPEIVPEIEPGFGDLSGTIPKYYLQQIPIPHEPKNDFKQDFRHPRQPEYLSTILDTQYEVKCNLRYNHGPRP